MERMFCSLDYSSNTNFSCVRFGNIAWSTGSVFPIWKKMMEDKNQIESTGSNMKRFILYVFFLLIWSNISFANEYILTCKSDKNFLTVYSINERLKKIIHLSSMSLISNQEFNDINYK